jgi:F0F1-type ATP synthase assembly protein I
VGGFYLFHNHPWLVVVVLIGVIAAVLYMQRRR